MAQESKKLAKDERFRDQFFPGGAAKVFNTKAGGFVPLPIVYRKLLGKLGHAEVRALIYLLLRASRQGLCYPPMEDMVRELGLKTKKHLMPALTSLEAKGFISMYNARGRWFFLVHDPRIAVVKLRELNQISDEEILEIDDLYIDLNQPPVDFGGDPKR